MENVKKYLTQHFAKNYLGELDLSLYSYLKIGGKAPHCLLLDDASSLCAFERHIVGKLPYRVLGKCTNVLISDHPLDEIIIFISPSCDNVWSKLPSKNDNHIIFPAGLLYSKAVRAAHKRSLGGLEFALGIPGSIGGAVRMNAGADGDETAQYLTHVFLFRDGIFGWVEKDFLSLRYRHSNIQDNEIVMGAAFLLNSLNEDQLRQKKLESLKNLQQRKQKQPLNSPSLGSTFKNPKGHYAAKLIQEAGLVGLKRGGVSISKKHANFLQNDGHGTAQDAMALIKTVEEEIFQRFAVQLEREVILLGRF